MNKIEIYIYSNFNQYLSVIFRKRVLVQNIISYIYSVIKYLKFYTILWFYKLRYKSQTNGKIDSNCLTQ